MNAEAPISAIDYGRLRAEPVRTDPYPFFIAEHVLPAGFADEVANDFPHIDRPGSVPVDELECGPAFRAVLDELESDRFRALMAEKFDVDLTAKAISMNARGQMRSKDGNIHTDTPVKLITVLLYFNKDWPGRKSALRILRNGHDLDDYVEEAPPTLGTMVAFKVTPNCWHGHTPVVGKRHSIQMNYLSGIERTGKHQRLHRLYGKARRAIARWRGKLPAEAV